MSGTHRGTDDCLYGGGIISAVDDEIGNSPAIGSNVTIACQTAPGDGVLIKAELKFRATQNIIMRYCRVRPGDVPDQSAKVTNAILGHDNVAAVTSDNYVILDHVSMGTSNDDSFGLYGPGPSRTYFTIQNSLLSEGTVNNAVSATQTFGALNGGAVLSTSWLHNVIISYGKRCPLLYGGRHQVVNNLCQYVGGEGLQIFPLYAALEIALVNNAFRTTASNQSMINIGGCGYSGWGLTNGDKNCKTAYDNASNIYIFGNIHRMLRPSAASGSETAMVGIYAGTNILNTKIQSTTPVAGMPTIASQHTAAEVRQYIIDNAGATYPVRDTFDLRAINDVMNEPPTGRVCGLYGTPESACLTYMGYASGTAPLDSDNDGMPNAYETANGLNPTNGADGATIISGGPHDGYSNLEVYLNQIVGGPPPDPDPPGPTLGDVTVCIDSHTFGASPSTATCDSAFGTPKGALALASMAVTSGETGNNARFSLGATDGTNQRTHSIADLGGGAANALTGRRQMTDMSLAFIDQAAAVDGEYSATGTPFTNDAVTYTSANTVTTPALGKVVMFGGNDLSVKVGTFASSATIGGTVDVTTVGFLADLVLHL